MNYAESDSGFDADNIYKKKLGIKNRSRITPSDTHSCVLGLGRMYLESPIALFSYAEVVVKYILVPCESKSEVTKEQPWKICSCAMHRSL